MKSNPRSALSALERREILLVFPINNRPEPRSLWSEFYPRSEMRWEWDDSGDDRVARLWHLRAQLAASGSVVYAKWYQGRATFFSKQVFPKMVAALNPEGYDPRRLSLHARNLYEILESDSPLSTKELRARLKN